MFTVKARMPHNLKPKLYGFTRSKDAEAFADQLQAAGIPNTLGHQAGISLEEQIQTARGSK